MKTSRFTDSQIIAILKQPESGSPVPELCREHGISNATFYKWRSKFSGMDASLMASMKELEEENRRLKKMYVEERLKAEIVAEALTKKWLWPAADSTDTKLRWKMESGRINDSKKAVQSRVQA